MISFIVPAYNEEEYIGGTLTAMEDAARSIGRPFEVIVVDDASTDGTTAIARQHHARIVSVSCRQIAAARNAGAREAAGDVLFFVDADTRINQAALEAALRAIQAGAVGGGCAFRFDRPLPLYARVMEALAVPIYRSLGLASGCFLFCTRDAFQKVGGFDEALFAAEEAVMSRSLRRHGRFVVLRENVTTSGRKLRTHSFVEILGVLARIALGGTRRLRRRKGLEIWYGGRRKDPGQPSRDGGQDRAGPAPP